MRSALTTTLAFSALTVVGCSSPSSPTLGPNPNANLGDGGAGGPLTCEQGASIVCMGTVATPCDGTPPVDCAMTGQICMPNVGCATGCTPNTFQCENNVSSRCTEAGVWEEAEQCSEGCGPVGRCAASLCDQAASSNSYIGCDYWPVPTANPQLDDAFEFAVVVANPQSMPAEVNVTRGGSSVASATVQPGSVEVLPLPWIDELKGEYQMEASALVRGGAYHLVSSVPVTVYQFNPLEYEGTGCEQDPLGGLLGNTGCFSYTNDASLLLPSHVMTGNYMAMTRASGQLQGQGLLGLGGSLVSTPGFFTVVAVGADPVDVNITFAGTVTASADGAVQAFTPGQSGSWTLQQGDVLQLLSGAPASCTEVEGASVNGNPLCAVGDEHDLSGSVIEATGPVGVFGGHSCAMVPFDVMACDHLEEMLFPLETWGKEFIVSASEQLRAEEPNLVRLVSGADGNEITFEPAVSEPVTLARGEVLEFEATEDFRITATEALSVGQFLVGQNFTGEALDMNAVGDPSFSLAIPTEQYRTDYTFLAPSTYEQNYVNVVAPVGATVMLDGQAVTGFVELAGTGYQVARVSIGGGQHSMESKGKAFGIVVYGFGAYTSYMYPGGLDLKAINII